MPMPDGVDTMTMTIAREDSRSRCNIAGHPTAGRRSRLTFGKPNKRPRENYTGRKAMLSDINKVSFFDALCG